MSRNKVRQYTLPSYVSIGIFQKTIIFVHLFPFLIIDVIIAIILRIPNRLYFDNGMKCQMIHKELLLWNLIHGKIRAESD